MGARDPTSLARVKNKTGDSVIFAGTGPKHPGSDLMTYSSSTFEHSKILGRDLHMTIITTKLPKLPSMVAKRLGPLQ